MKSLLERLISRFKEFWNRSKNPFKSKDYTYVFGINACSPFFDITPAHRVFCSLPDYVCDKFLDGGNVKIKTGIRYLCLQNEFEPADFEVFKMASSFGEIALKSKFSLCEDSDKVDIDFWLHGAGEKIKLKKKLIVFGKSYFKNKMN